MSQRYLGGVITANPTLPTLSSASGVWTLEQDFQYSSSITPQVIGNSVRLRSSASAYFNRTPASAGNQKTWTWSGWVKRGTLGVLCTLFASRVSNNDSQAAAIYIGSDDKIAVLPWSNSFFISSAVLRDPSAWYHIVVAFDTTQATATDRVKVYINGVNQAGTYPLAITQNANYAINQAGDHRLGDFPAAGFSTFDGYLTEVNFIDGQALTPSSFGAYDTNGIWQPLPYTGTYGTNGFYLTFADNSGATATTIGKDYSGNGNNWTPNNISVTSGVTYDWMLDTPTNSDNGGTGRGNYAVLNPLFAGTSSYISGGNLNASVSATNTNVVGTFQIPSSGKWYWEYQITTIGGGGAPMGGIATTSANSPAVFYRSNGDKLVDGTGSAYGSTYTTTDTIGVAVDVDGGTVTFYKNNTSQGAITYAASGFYPALRSNAATDVFNINFGQRPFAYTPPTGFKALNTQNLPSVNINNGAQYMAATLWTGAGQTGSGSITGVGFQPDFVWAKSRSAGNSHTLFNSVVGGGANKGLSSNSTDSEASFNDNATYGYLTSFDSNGFSYYGGSSPAYFSANAATYVAWSWKAGGTAVSNTSGSITSSVSANTTAGFSIVTYTGTGSAATVGHGLGVTPQMFIVKSRSVATGWPVYHAFDNASPATGYMALQTTDAFFSSTAFNNTAPTSTVFSVGGAGVSTNNSAATYVAYCWAEVAGFSKFGSYTGNGSTDGPFVYCGFLPRYVMIKRSDGGAEQWNVIDTARNPYNTTTYDLAPSSSGAETTSSALIDVTANGFKLRFAGTPLNTSGGTYIYAAFAENPFNISRAR